MWHLMKPKILSSTCCNEKSTAHYWYDQRQIYRTYRSGLNSILVPDSPPFQTEKMSIYPIITKQDMIGLAKLSEEEKIQTAIKYIKKISVQFHNRKLADFFIPTNKK